MHVCRRCIVWRGYRENKPPPERYFLSVVAILRIYVLLKPPPKNRERVRGKTCDWKIKRFSFFQGKKGSFFLSFRERETKDKRQRASSRGGKKRKKKSVSEWCMKSCIKIISVQVCDWWIQIIMYTFIFFSSFFLLVVSFLLFFSTQKQKQKHMCVREETHTHTCVWERKHTHT